MSENPYAPPKAAVADAPEGPRVRPRAVGIAVALLWTELVLSVVLTFLGWKEFVGDEPEFLMVFQVFIALWLGISVLVNVKIWQGRNWARILCLVLTGLGMIEIIGIADDFAQAPVEAAMSTAALALDIAAMVLVFGPGRDWFRRRS